MGFAAEYPAETVEWAAALALIARPGITLASGVLVAFAAGESVPPALLRHVLRMRLMPLADGLEAHDGSGPPRLQRVMEGLGPYLDPGDIGAIVDMPAVRGKLRAAGVSRREAIAALPDMLPNEPAIPLFRRILDNLDGVDDNLLELFPQAMPDYPLLTRTADGVFVLVGAFFLNGMLDADERLDE